MFLLVWHTLGTQPHMHTCMQLKCVEKYESFPWAKINKTNDKILHILIKRWPIFFGFSSANFYARLVHNVLGMASVVMPCWTSNETIWETINRQLFVIVILMAL